MGRIQILSFCNNEAFILKSLEHCAYLQKKGHSSYKPLHSDKMSTQGKALFSQHLYVREVSYCLGFFRLVSFGFLLSSLVILALVHAEVNTLAMCCFLRLGHHFMMRPFWATRWGEMGT